MKRLYIINALYSFFITSILLANVILFKINSYKNIDPKELEIWWLHHILWYSILLLPICLVLFILTGLKIKFPKPYNYFFLVNIVVITLIFLFNIDFIIWYLD